MCFNLLNKTLRLSVCMGGCVCPPIGAKTKNWKENYTTRKNSQKTRENDQKLSNIKS